MAAQVKQARCVAGPRGWSPEEAARREFELLRLLSSDRQAQKLYLRRCAVEKAAVARLPAGQATAGGAQQQASTRRKPGQRERRARRAARAIQAVARGMLARRWAARARALAMPMSNPQQQVQPALNSQAPAFVPAARANTVPATDGAAEAPPQGGKRAARPTPTPSTKASPSGAAKKRGETWVDIMKVGVQRELFPPEERAMETCPAGLAARLAGDGAGTHG